MKLKFFFSVALVLGGGLAARNSEAAIVYPKEPEGGRQMVMQFASEFVGKNLPPFKGISTTNDLTFAPPMLDFQAGNLAKGDLLAGATSGGNGWQGWKYIFMHGTNIVGEAWLEADEKTGKAIKCDSIGESGFNVEIETALCKAAQMPEVQTQDYEVRLLDDHLVSFFGMWLHGKTNDIIIPLAPTYNRMQAYQPYSEKQIIKILEPEAKRDVVMWKTLNEERQHDNDAYVKAMTDYEKAHGTDCGPISYYGERAPYQIISRHLETIILIGKSSTCGKLEYKVRITYTGNMADVKKIEVLEKLPATEIKDDL